MDKYTFSKQAITLLIESIKAVKDALPLRCCGPSNLPNVFLEGPEIDINNTGCYAVTDSNGIHIDVTSEHTGLSVDNGDDDDGNNGNNGNNGNGDIYQPYEKAHPWAFYIAFGIGAVVMAMVLTIIIVAIFGGQKKRK